MRILMLAQSYPPIIGGEERHVHNLSLELTRRGHDVVVATLWQDGTSILEDDENVRIHRIRTSMQRASNLFTEKGRQHAPPFPDPEVLWSLYHIIQREKPDIIHAHNWMVHSFTPLKVWSKAKLVVTLHDYSLVCATQRLMYQGAICIGPSLSRCLRCSAEHYGAVKGVPTMLANALSQTIEHKVVDMYLPVSQAVVEGAQLARQGVPYRVVPNFIPDNLAQLCDHGYPLLTQLPQENYLLFVGDLSKEKGVEILLQAYSGLENPLPLVLIGRPVHDFATHIPSNVQVLQSWPHAAVMSAWSRSTIAVVPSIWPDPCPTVAMEAMAMQKPIIASRIGGLSDIVSDNETGFLITPNDPHTLRAAIQCLSDDPVRREHMGVLARQRVSKFQASTVVSRIERTYQEVLRQ